MANHEECSLSSDLGGNFAKCTHSAAFWGDKMDWGGGGLKHVNSNEFYGLGQKKDPKRDGLKCLGLLYI